MLGYKLARARRVVGQRTSGCARSRRPSSRSSRRRPASPRTSACSRRRTRSTSTRSTATARGADAGADRRRRARPRVRGGQGDARAHARRVGRELLGGDPLPALTRAARSRRPRRSSASSRRSARAATRSTTRSTSRASAASRPPIVDHRGGASPRSASAPRPSASAASGPAALGSCSPSRPKGFRARCVLDAAPRCHARLRVRLRRTTAGVGRVGRRPVNTMSGQACAFDGRLMRWRRRLAGSADVPVREGSGCTIGRCRSPQSVLERRPAPPTRDRRCAAASAAC